LISYKYSFIFIHIYKIAGSSIRKALRKYAYPNRFKLILNLLTKSVLKRLGKNIILPYYPEMMLPAHISAKELQNHIPEDIFKEFYKFAFVRNPWDWQVSFYFYMKQNPNHFQYDIVKTMTFEEYINWRVESDLKLQKDSVVDDNGDLLVDFIGRYENLNADFQAICDRLGIRASLPYRNKSTHRDYREYYTEETKRIVEVNFKEDIDFFGYTFD